MNTYVTKPFLPPLEEYLSYIRSIWENNQLTNQGPFVKKLEGVLKEFLQVDHLRYVNNGTMALQLALRSLDITDGEIITTPFSYVATTSSILWERCTPIFVDIEPDNFTIDTDKIEQAITDKTKAIMAVHVFGYPCNVEKIQRIADKHGLKVIYDAAHAFGSRYKNKSLASYGDIATLSFHATKLFHTVEGGACIVKDKEVFDKLSLFKCFGHDGDDHLQLGINAKSSEMHAAMGLANFPYIEKIMASRKHASDRYDSLLGDSVRRPKKIEELEYNYAYYPIIFKNQDELLRIFSALQAHNIYPRRYFYPSLNKIPYVKGASCPVSEGTSVRIACLPLFHDLEGSKIEEICKTIKDHI